MQEIHNLSLTISLLSNTIIICIGFFVAAAFCKYKLFLEQLEIKQKLKEIQVKNNLQDQELDNIERQIQEIEFRGNK